MLYYFPIQLVFGYDGWSNKVCTRIALCRVVTVQGKMVTRPRSWHAVSSKNHIRLTYQGRCTHSSRCGMLLANLVATSRVESIRPIFSVPTDWILQLFLTSRKRMQLLFWCEQNVLLPGLSSSNSTRHTTYSWEFSTGLNNQSSDCLWWRNSQLYFPWSQSVRKMTRASIWSSSLSWI